MSLAAWQRASIKRKNKVTGGGVLCGNTKSSRKGCSLRDGQACVRADSQIEAHPRSMMWPHTHLNVSVHHFHPIQLNETHLWREHTAHALPHAGFSMWMQTHTHTHVHRCIVSKADMKIKIEWEDCFFLFPCMHNGSYITFLLVSLVSASCCDLPFLLSLLFFNPVANISLILSTYGRLCPLSCFLSLPFFFS